MKSADKTLDGRWVYCRFIRRNGRVIYPKNARFFRFWVPNKK
jgi:ribosomal protein L36